MTAPFRQRLATGQAHGEAPVQRWLERAGWQVWEASAADQRCGLDLWATVRGAPAVSLEVKVQTLPRDAMFLELRRTEAGLPAEGWLATTQADWLALVEHWGRFAILCRPAALRREVGGWLSLYGQAPGAAHADTRTRSTGCWVPWHELHACGRLWWLSGPAPDAAWMLAPARAGRA